MWNNTTSYSDWNIVDISKEDATWILSNAFLVLTMQTGFGMLEAGTVSSKNIANIMIKNVMDVTIGGIAYWSIGYGLSFGHYGNSFIGFGNFFVTAQDTRAMPSIYAHYIFHFSYATAATTIVSGAVAERMKLGAYMSYSFVNIIIYCIPCHWVWTKEGWLAELGFYDFAGASIVHMSGGAGALVGAAMLGPRLGRYAGGADFGMSSPVAALTGTFMLWWACLAYICGSTFGLGGDRWRTATKVAVNTMNGSIGGSLAGIGLSLAGTRGRFIHIPTIICSVLAGLVSMTAGCSLFTPGECLVVGAVGAIIAVSLVRLLDVARLDDPVGATSIHLGAAVWSTISVGLFARNEFGILSHAGATDGLFHGGGWRLLAVQTLGAAAVAGWAAAATGLAFFITDKAIGIRMSREDELDGADWTEHRVKSETLAQLLAKAIRRMEADEDVDRNGQLFLENMSKLLKNAMAMSADVHHLRRRSEGQTGRLQTSVAPQ